MEAVVRDRLTDHGHALVRERADVSRDPHRIPINHLAVHVLPLSDLHDPAGVEARVQHRKDESVLRALRFMRWLLRAITSTEFCKLLRDFGVSASARWRRRLARAWVMAAGNWLPSVWRPRPRLDNLTA